MAPNFTSEAEKKRHKQMLKDYKRTIKQNSKQHMHPRSDDSDRYLGQQFGGNIYGEGAIHLDCSGGGSLIETTDIAMALDAEKLNPSQDCLIDLVLSHLTTREEAETLLRALIRKFPEYSDDRLEEYKVWLQQTNDRASGAKNMSRKDDTIVEISEAREYLKPVHCITLPASSSGPLTSSFIPTQPQPPDIPLFCTMPSGFGASDFPMHNSFDDPTSHEAPRDVRPQGETMRYALERGYMVYDNASRYNSSSTHNEAIGHGSVIEFVSSRRSVSSLVPSGDCLATLIDAYVTKKEDVDKYLKQVAKMFPEYVEENEELADYLRASLQETSQPGRTLSERS
ncbi:hypothetical protein NMY22_g16283 [Coprinellus aureogranulatus]|nr:hypothetical protein NMY22_g16283 [Coprinellus aureogranulatus]